MRHCVLRSCPLHSACLRDLIHTLNRHALSQASIVVQLQTLLVYSNPVWRLCVFTDGGVIPWRDGQDVSSGHGAWQCNMRCVQPAIAGRGTTILETGNKLRWRSRPHKFEASKLILPPGSHHRSNTALGRKSRLDLLKHDSHQGEYPATALCIMIVVLGLGCTQAKWWCANCMLLMNLDGRESFRPSAFPCWSSPYKIALAQERGCISMNQMRVKPNVQKDQLLPWLALRQLPPKLCPMRDAQSAKA